MRALGFTFMMLLAASFCTKVATAAEFSRHKQDSGVVLIGVSGEIVEHDDDKFLRMIDGVERGIIVLDSPGGSLFPAINMGRAIRSRGLTTLVPDNGVCASGCAMMWLGGTKRFVSSTARIGFHAAYTESFGFASESGSGNAIVGSYYASLGLKDEAIYYLTSSGPGDMFWIDADKARELGIELTVVPSSEPPAAEESRPDGFGYWLLTRPGAVLEQILK